MTYLTFSFNFAAFHRMWNASLSEEENLRTFGKCANPNGHGHNYRVEITISGVVTNEEPFVLTRAEIESLKKEVLLPKFECVDLSVFGRDFISSGENLAKKIWDVMLEQYPSSPRLELVKVIETSRNYFSYSSRAMNEIHPSSFPCC